MVDDLRAEPQPFDETKLGSYSYINNLALYRFGRRSAGLEEARGFFDRSPGSNPSDSSRLA